MKPNRAVIKVQRRQLDRKLADLRQLRRIQPPGTGWVKAIRESLGMTVEQLAKRAKIAAPTLYKLEQSEQRGTISLKALRKLAAVLGCQFTYAVIPEKSLEEIVDEQALRMARKVVEKTSHTMALEDQQSSEKERLAQIEDVARDLKKKRPSVIWEDDH